MKRNIIIVTVALSLASAFFHSANASDPSAYLKEVLDIIQNRALNSDKVNWNLVRNRASSMAISARNTFNTYPAIVYALNELKDNHSFLLDRSGHNVSYSSRKYSSNYKRNKRVARSHYISRGNKLFGFIVVGGLSADNKSAKAKQFAQSILGQIKDVAQRNPSGWIVDLRSNGGGNMWPMLGGLGPIIGKGTLGYFKYKNVEVPWFYEDGRAGVINVRKNKYTKFEVGNTIPMTLLSKPVAVLIDGATASSGEAVAISFKGRSRTKFFGHKTLGLSTANETIPLSDGATLYLTTSVECDKNHVVYADGVSPDVNVDQSNVQLGDESDPVIKAATDWLMSQ